MSKVVSFTTTANKQESIRLLREFLEAFEKDEIVSFTLSGRRANGDMHGCHSACPDLFEELAIVSYHQHLIMRRINRTEVDRTE